MNRKNTFIALSLMFPLVLTGCSTDLSMGSKNVKRENMPPEVKQKMEAQIAAGEKKLAAAKDENAKKDALLEIAFGNGQLGNFDTAIPKYEAMLQLDPKDFIALNNLGVAYEELKNYAKAAEYYGKILVNTPSNTEAIEDTVRVLILDNQLQKAQTTLDEVSASLSKENKLTPDFKKLLETQSAKILAAKNPVPVAPAPTAATTAPTAATKNAQ